MMKIRTAAVAAAVAATGLVAVSAGSANAQTDRPGVRPTVVLVHGAFADSSGWNAVTRRLLADGYPVVAAANPLRGVASDAAQVRALLDSVEGPIVLVGHSYGGNVISTAAAGDSDVKALVFVAAFLPETGETAAGLSGKFPGSTLGDTLEQVPLPDGHTDLYIKQSLYPQQFAADVPLKDAKLAAVSQRPIDAAALNEPAAGPQAWRTIASYSLIAEADRNIPPAAQHWMAKRAHARTESVKGASHSVFLSHPDTTARFIERATSGR